MTMKRNNLGLIVSAVLIFLCIHHVNSKPMTEQQDSSSSSAFVSTGAQVEYENGLDLLRRITRQADPANGNNKMCKYKKGSWSACDPSTKVRTRTFTLKRGDRAVCEEQKTIRKECKGKKEGARGGGKRNKARDNNNNNQQPKNNRERDRPRKKNNHNNNN